MAKKVTSNSHDPTPVDDGEEVYWLRDGESVTVDKIENEESLGNKVVIEDESQDSTYTEEE